MGLTLKVRIGVACAVLALSGCAGDEDTGEDEPKASPSDAPSSPSSPPPSSQSPRALWPLPQDPMARTREAGLEPEVKEHLTHHAHSHLDVFVDGAAGLVPGGIGINIDDPDVQAFDVENGLKAYGGIEQCRRPCISPLHTHDPDGIIHTESKIATPNTLGQFFDEWAVALTSTCVADRCSPEPIAFYVDGEEYAGDPRAIELTDGKEIAVVVGDPPTEIPSSADFSGA